jgi:hypothetical protein
VWVTGLTPGSQTFTVQYRTDNADNICTFKNRNITVIPAP